MRIKRRIVPVSGVACAIVLSVVMLGSATAYGTRSASVGHSSLSQVDVSFEGLMALVRSSAFDQASVLVVEATHATLRRDLPPHRPILVIPVAAVRGARPDSYADAQHTLGVWNLQNQDVSFRRVASGLNSRIRPVRTADGVQYPTSPAEWRDVKWIVDMDRLVGAGRGRVKDEFMTKKDLRDTVVASRVTLESGTLASTEPAEPWNRGEMRFLPLQGQPAARPYQQAATHRLVFTPDIDSTLRIVLSPFDSSPVRELELLPTAAPVHVTISNLPTVSHLLNAHHDEPPQAVHFLAFYDLLATPAAEPVVPSALVPYPSVRTTATPGAFCPGDWPSFVFDKHE